MKIDDKLWAVYGHGLRKGNEIRVTKVGRVWIETSDGNRFRKDDPAMRFDGRGYSSPGQAYISRQAFTDERDLKHTWGWFWQQVYNQTGNGAPDGVTREQIFKAAELLGFRDVPAAQN